MIQEIIYAIILLLWVSFVTFFITKSIYNAMLNKGIEKNVAVYFNRKIIHVLAGGLVAILVPILFSDFLIPFILGLILAIALYIPHKTKRLFYWFQDPSNYFEVHFCIMWSLLLALGWIIFKNPWYAIVPILFMSIGDAATGFVRNAIYKRRTKSWIGNLAMGIVCIPIGSIIGIPGIIAGIISSIVEHFEFKYIDDNITVPLVSFFIIYLLLNFPSI